MKRNRKQRFPIVCLVLLFNTYASAWTVDGNAYTTRKKISTQNANCDSALTAFPLYVHIDADSDIGAGTNADGHDIRFTQSDGSTLLNYERLYHNVAAGELTAHYFVATAVSDAAATDIYIYYRAADTADGENATGTWDASYLAVYHMDESSGFPLDSTGDHNSNASTIDGSVGYQAAGPIQYCYDMADAQFEIPDHADWDFDEFTIQAWIDPDVIDVSSEVFVRLGGTNSERCEIRQSNTGDGTWLFRTYDGTYSACESAAAPDGTFQFIVGTMDTSGNHILYVDGSAEADTETNDFGYADDAKFYIGDNYSSGWGGLIAECRISNTDRSAAWIKFEYYNINEADHELTWGSEETEGAATAAQIY